jgi:hypothetical protein
LILENLPKSTSTHYNEIDDEYTSIREYRNL